MNHNNPTFVSADLSHQSYMEAHKTLTVAEEGLSVGSWSKVSNVASLEIQFDSMLYQSIHPRMVEAIGWVDSALVGITWTANTKTAHISAHAHYEDAIEKGIERATQWCNIQEENSSEVVIAFWALGANGPKSWYRQIEVPTWDEIHGNYPPVVQQDLMRLIEIDHNTVDGKLVLMHGFPGGGKTYAIRSLLRAWDKGIQASYIIDPEKFFSSNPDYMLDVVLESEEDKCNVIILEDTGELLRADAKERSGQGLSRLLNLVDGLIGQGLNLMTILTTNEEINTFHPAVTRSGRCLAKIHFDKFSVEGANQWLRERNCDIRVQESKSLADLYAIHEGRLRNQEEAVNVGAYV